MTVNQLKESEEFNAFVAYLKGIWSSDLEFKFNLRKDHRGLNCRTINSLSKARENYFWPYNLGDSEIPNNIEKKGTNLEQSEYVLNHAKSLIIKENIFCNPESIRLGTKLILKWGKTLRGNDFILVPDFDILDLFRKVQHKWNDILLDCKIDFNEPIGFNSNAGFSKVYSAFLNDFIIYDSRVGAGLAYLMYEKFIKRLNKSIPEKLLIFIPPYRKVAHAPNRRNVEPFLGISANLPAAHQKHFYSNVIASLIVKSAVDEINRGSDQKITTRDFEAALFMIGYDVRNLPCEAKN